MRPRKPAHAKQVHSSFQARSPELEEAADLTEKGEEASECESGPDTAVKKGGVGQIVFKDAAKAIGRPAKADQSLDLMAIDMQWP